MGIACLVVAIQGILPNDWKKNNEEWEPDAIDVNMLPNIVKSSKFNDLCLDPIDGECSVMDGTNIRNMAFKRSKFDEDPILASALSAVRKLRLVFIHQKILNSQRISSCA